MGEPTLPKQNTSERALVLAMSRDIWLMSCELREDLGVLVNQDPVVFRVCMSHLTRRGLVERRHRAAVPSGTHSNTMFWRLSEVGSRLVREAIGRRGRVMAVPPPRMREERE
jgi:hypothetical protein